MKRGGISWWAAATAALVAVWTVAQLAARPPRPEVRDLVGDRLRCAVEVDETRVALRAPDPAAVEAWLDRIVTAHGPLEVERDHLVFVIDDPFHTLARDPNAFHSGRLAFQRVLEGTPLMMKLAQRAHDERPAGITAETESWANEDDDSTHRDYFLVAEDGEALVSWLRSHVDGEELRRAGQTLLFEPVGGRWRTYLASAKVELGSADVVEADVFWDPTTGRPEVLVTFTGEGARRFAELTGAHVGRKLAIVVDGIVSSAPVIKTAITGGKTNISMGVHDVRGAQEEADRLLAALRVREPPPGIELLSVQPYTRPCDTRALQLALGAGAGLLFLALAFVTARLFPTAVAQRPLLPPRGWFPWGRLAVTLVAFAALRFAPPISLPGLGREVREALPEAATEALSGFALGILPLVAGFVVVELAALLVPAWRDLRTGDAAGRAKLDRAAVITGILIATAQAYTVARWMPRTPDDPFVEPGRVIFLADVMTLVAGTLVLGLVAALLNRFGAGSGVVVVFLATWGRGPLDATTLRDLAGMALTVVATAWILRRAAPGARRLPASGIVVLSYAGAMAALVNLVPITALLPIWLRGALPHGWNVFAQLSLLAGVNVLLAMAFSRRGAGLGVAATVSTLYVLAVGLLTLGTPIPMVSVALATAVAADVLADLRTRPVGLVEIRSLHCLDDASAVLAALVEAGIPAHMRNLATRTLLQFFGPFAPIAVLVPADRADEAREIVARALAK